MADDPFDFLTPDQPLDTSPDTSPAPTPDAAPASAPQLEGQTPAPAVEVPASAGPAIPPGYVPLQSTLDERDKRKQAEKERDELRAWRAAQERPAKAPDVTSDPQGWQAAQEARFAKNELDTKMQLSGSFAEQHYGKDMVQAAMVWGKERADSDSFFGDQFVAQRNPFGWLVEQHRQAQALALIGSEAPTDWAAKWAEANGYVKATDGAAQQQPATTQVAAQPSGLPRPSAPPRSIASAPPAGGTHTAAILSDAQLMD